jgi:hypothetical protein
MKKLLLFLALVLSVFFYSCSDDNDDNNDNNGTPSEVKKRISKITVTEDDETIIKEFKYDQSGNLAEFKQTSLENNTTNYIETRYFTYEDGKLIKSSMKSTSDDDEASEYRYHLDSVFVTEIYSSYLDTLIIKNGLMTKETDENEYVLYEYDSNANLKQWSMPDSNPERSTIAKYTYDSKVSIFSNQGNFPIWYWLYTGYDEHYYTGANNILSTVVDNESSTEPYTTTYSYQYDKDGYPTICDYVDAERGTEKIVYEYETIK